MRFHSAKSGDKRNQSAFLWFPMTIDHETRWLERASWVEQASYSCYDGLCWDALEWL